MSAKHKEGKKRLILQMKDEIDGSSAIHLGTLLEKAINNRITHLTLDFSGVLHLDYTGILFSVAVLEFYASDFSEIICCGLPTNISHVFKGFGVKKIPGLRIVACDDRDTQSPIVCNL